MKTLLILSLVSCAVVSCWAAPDVKKCEFCGSFYPTDPAKLEETLDRLLGTIGPTESHAGVLGIIVPHAGYPYSGSVAAQSYKLFTKESGIETVILLGSTHRYPFDGIAVYPAGVFQVPIGSLSIDTGVSQQLQSLPFVLAETKYFSNEHTIEVQLPFIIKTLKTPMIVPVLFGNVTYEQVKSFAQMLASIARQKRILVVASSDLSHYLSYDQARIVDEKTSAYIREKDSLAIFNEYHRACGIAALTTIMEYIRLRGADIKIVAQANSGDTAGDKHSVVGYLSAGAFLPQHSSADTYNTHTRNREERPMSEYTLSREEKTTLLRIARTTLENHFKNKTKLPVEKPTENLTQKRGAFVTLTKHGELRGCIGRIVGDTPLFKVVSAMAIEAATADPRFLPVGPDELRDIQIEISVLTPFEKISRTDEIVVGTHGLMVQKGFSSGLLLPQVPGEYGWDRTAFLEQTCRKAGLEPDAYKDPSANLYIFSAIVFNEAGL